MIAENVRTLGGTVIGFIVNIIPIEKFTLLLSSVISFSQEKLVDLFSSKITFTH